MKTLADLKRNADKYLWSVNFNSWFKEIALHQREFRSVAIKQSNSIGFATIIKGENKISWMDWPKASELEIEPINNWFDNSYRVTITRKIENRPDHVMIYELKPIN